MNDLEYFVKHHCVGKEYDSCSPCGYSGGPAREGGGFECRHPEHPKNRATLTEYDRLKAQRTEIEQRGKPTRAELVEAILCKYSNVTIGDAEGILALLESKGLDITRFPKCSPTIEDGFGGTWSAYCPECKRKSMTIVRPGKVQCGYCG